MIDMIELCPSQNLWAFWALRFEATLIVVFDGFWTMKSWKKNHMWITWYHLETLSNISELKFSHGAILTGERCRGRCCCCRFCRPGKRQKRQQIGTFQPRLVLEENVWNMFGTCLEHISYVTHFGHFPVLWHTETYCTYCECHTMSMLKSVYVKFLPSLCFVLWGAMIYMGELKDVNGEIGEVGEASMGDGLRWSRGMITVWSARPWIAARCFRCFHCFLWCPDFWIFHVVKYVRLPGFAKIWSQTKSEVRSHVICCDREAAEQLLTAFLEHLLIKRCTSLSKIHIFSHFSGRYAVALSLWEQPLVYSWILRLERRRKSFHCGILEMIYKHMSI